jgi:uncharacterized protein YjbI with pentapeptide repeats
LPDGRRRAGSSADAGRGALRADCERCFGLCCAAPAFAASADFAIDKQAGAACPNLRSDFHCAIHDRLRSQGFRGCAVYDCFGAGQKVAQVTFGGQDWRQMPGIAAPMFAAFMIMRQLHELLWYLNEALALQPASPIHAELRVAFDQTERLTHASPDALAELDLTAHRGAISTLLRQASELARAAVAGARASHPGAGHDPSAQDSGARDPGASHTGAGHPARADYAGGDLAGADLIGKDLSGADLSGASLRGAYLIGASLRGTDLTAADLTGADLRGADLCGANLTGAIFLTQSQLDAASGDHRTTVPPSLARPAHWLDQPGRPA